MSENNNKMTQAMHRRDFLKHSASSAKPTPKPGGLLRLGLAYADEVLVMQRGRVVDQGRRSAIFTPPYQAYTDLLFSSEPEMDPDWLDHLLAQRAASTV
ncbi:hypothetical protein [Pseudomonas salomonii]|uniref:Uncharacterized protein n=1 Tax=Pseudomonas salomonii TaxID=191391 RepID=A0A1H3SFR3_9PSED|nr:hypothetical protein SAMN05216247_109131 [Pseudomonas salomonii]